MDLGTDVLDVTAGEEGRWFHWDQDTSFLLRRWGTTDNTKLFQRLTAPYDDMLQRKQDLPVEVDRRIMATVISETVIVDWHGITDAGNEVPFTKEKAQEIFLDPRFDHLRGWVMTKSQDLRNFYASEVADQAKNSASSSDGKTLGESTKTSSEESNEGAES